MTITNKGFNVFVVVIVVLTGAGFGIFTGFSYSEDFFWVGGISGIIGGYIVAQLYLWLLKKISAKGLNSVVIWLAGTLIAAVCGMLCTTLVHGTMTVVMYFNSQESLMHLMDGFWPIVIIVGEIIGAGAGFIVGGICSLAYTAWVRGKRDETAGIA